MLVDFGCRVLTAGGPPLEGITRLHREPYRFRKLDRPVHGDAHGAYLLLPIQTAPRLGVEAEAVFAFVEPDRCVVQWNPHPCTQLDPADPSGTLLELAQDLLEGRRGGLDDTLLFGQFFQQQEHELLRRKLCELWRGRGASRHERQADLERLAALRREAGLQPRPMRLDGFVEVVVDDAARFLGACAIHDLPSIEGLLAQGVEPNVRDAEELGALHHAVLLGSGEQGSCIDTLLRAGTDADAAAEHGITPLMLAAWWGTRGAVEELLPHADAERQDAFGRTARDFAAARGTSHGHDRIVALLDAAGA